MPGIGETANKLLLPEEMKVLNVFRVSLLQPWKQRDGGPAPTQVLLIKDDEQFEVDTVLDHQGEGSGKRRNMSYLVSWKGYSAGNNSETRVEHEKCFCYCTRILEEEEAVSLNCLAETS